jgi:hypothetical protein
VSRARSAVSWLASPLAYPSLQVARQTRCRVLLGPFAGMRYPLGFLAGGHFVGPAQVGSYEAELHEAIERLTSAAPQVLVNVGAADGYYSVGLARRLPQLTVIAFESDPAMRDANRRLARLNGVESRIELRGECTHDALAALEEPIGERTAAVLMDCEGCEAALAQPSAAAWMQRATWLVELHASIDAGIEQRLESRLAASHETTVIRARPPWASQWAELARLRGLRAIDRELLVAEFRHGGQDWLRAAPR